MADVTIPYHTLKFYHGSAFCEVSQCDMFSLMDLSVYPSIVRWMEQCKGLAGYDKSHATVLKLAPKIKKVRGVWG